MDHVVPQCMNGSNEDTNLQTLCQRCNGWKDDTIIDFRTMPRALRLAWVADQLALRMRVPVVA